MKGLSIFMQYTREAALNRLMESYKAYFNIDIADNTQEYLRAVCEFFEHTEKYVLSRQANLWAANCEEFVYLFSVEQLTAEIFEKCRDFAREDGMKRAHIGPGHMYTYITPVFICDACQEDARRAVRKCRIYKSFKFSLHGWMDFHAAVLEVESNRITTNGSGKCVEKVLKNVLFKDKKKRRRFL